jgi:hypothetical protein
MQDETLKHAMNWETVTGVSPLTGEPSRALQQMLAIYGPNGVRQVMAGAAMMNAQAHSQDVQSKVYYRGHMADNQDDVLKIRRAQGVLAGYKADAESARRTEPEVGWESGLPTPLRTETETEIERGLDGFSGSSRTRGAQVRIPHDFKPGRVFGLRLMQSKPGCPDGFHLVLALSPGFLI